MVNGYFPMSALRLAEIPDPLEGHRHAFQFLLRESAAAAAAAAATDW